MGGDEAIDLRPRGREIVRDLQRDRRPRLGLVKVEGDVVDQVVDLVGIALDDGDDAVKVKPRRLVGLQLGAAGGAVVGGDIQRGQGGAAVSRARKSVVEGKSVSVRVDLGGRRTIKKKNSQHFNFFST